MNIMLLQQAALRIASMGEDEQILSELYNISEDAANIILRAMTTPEKIEVTRESHGRDNY